MSIYVHTVIVIVIITIIVNVLSSLLLPSSCRHRYHQRNHNRFTLITFSLIIISTVILNYIFDLFTAEKLSTSHRTPDFGLPDIASTELYHDDCFAVQSSPALTHLDKCLTMPRLTHVSDKKVIIM